MAKKKRGKSEIEKQYAKEVARIKAAMRREIKKGYEFDVNILPNKPKRITEGSIRRLKKITPKVIRSKGTYLSLPERTGSRQEGEGNPVTDSGFLKERRKKDRAQKAKLKRDKAYMERMSIGNIIYERLLRMIGDVERSYQKAGEHLKEALEKEINEYGRERTLQAIAQAPEEAVELATVALRYNEGDMRHDTAIRELMMLISGRLPTAEESRAMQEAIDEDIYTDGV